MVFLMVVKITLLAGVTETFKGFREIYEMQGKTPLLTITSFY